MLNERTGQEFAVDGGLVITGEHAAFAQSRLPHIDEVLRGTASLEDALTRGIATEAEIESYEVSVAIGGPAITYSTRSSQVGKTIGTGDFSIRSDGKVAHERLFGGDLHLLLYEVDVFEPEFTFVNQTPSTSQAIDWMETEKRHLARHAIPVS